MPDPVEQLSAVPPALLIAEDKPQAIRLLHDWVAYTYPRCRILNAATAEEVRRLASTERPAVILVDIDMHDARGFDILRVLRSTMPEAQLIALSMFHADAYRDYAAGAGAKACLSMATLDSRLKETISALLAPAATNIATGTPLNPQAPEHSHAGD